MVEVEGKKARVDYAAPSYVTITRGTIGDVRIVSEFGAVPGMLVDELRAQGPDAEHPYEDGRIALNFGIDRNGQLAWTNVRPKYALLAMTGPDGRTVQSIEYAFYSRL